MPEKVLDSKPYAWERPGFDIKSLFDYKQACETSAMMVMRRTLFEQIDVLRQKRKDIRIIDGGCGCGRWVIYLNRKGFNCVGVDANGQIISKVKEFDASIRFEAADLRALPFPNNSFDLYYSFGVFEHFEEGMDKVLSEARRILRPGGRLLFTVPTPNIIKRIFKPVRDIRRRFNSANHVYFREYRFGMKELINIVKRAGFEIIEYGASDEVGMGLWEDFQFLRAPGIFRLTPIGVKICKTFNFVSPWITNWGIIIVAEKA